MPLQEEFEQQGNFLFKHRSYIPILILLASFIIYTNSIRDGKDPFGTGIVYLSLGVSIIGLLIRIYTVGHSPANTSGRNTAAGQVADTLNQQGIYSIVRHPLYLGNFLMYLGFALLPMSIFFVIIFCLLFWIYYERIMFAEEQFLRGKFNTMYLNWALKTPAFIPNFSLFNSAEIHFSWKKILKKEKNGLAALFFIFWIFYILRNYLMGKVILDYSFWTLAMVICILLYFILKFIKQNTNWLDEAER